MNWYRTLYAESLINRIKHWFTHNKNDAEDSGLEVWMKGSDVFASIGDWGDREIITELEDALDRDVEWDYEVGSPGSGWIKVK